MRSRQRYALIACLLWLAGVEVLPAIHEGLHARLAPHTHVGNTIVTTSFEDTTHVHADGTVHYVAPKHDDGHRRYQRPIDQHVADGLAHHAAALHVPPPLPILITTTPQPMLPAIAEAHLIVSSDPLAPSARGPPVVAFAA